MNKWYLQSGAQDDIVLSTRIRLARNMSGVPFPSKMNVNHATHVVSAVRNALSASAFKFAEYAIAKLPKIDAQILLEEYVISPAMLDNPRHSAVFVSEDDTLSVMVNEEDHIRMQCIFAGFEADKAFEMISKLDDFIGEKVDYAMHEKYGFLTSCLTNVGTGMRISCMLHLPALVLSGAYKGLFSAVGKLGIAVRGLYGEGSEAAGHLFQISNQITLGLSEVEIARKMQDVIGKITAKEREMRTALMAENNVVVSDKICRAYGILKYAKIMSARELIEHLSYVRLGVSEGIITDFPVAKISSMMIETRPAHVAKHAGAELSPDKRDEVRAKMINTILG